MGPPQVQCIDRVVDVPVIADSARCGWRDDWWADVLGSERPAPPPRQTQLQQPQLQPPRRPASTPTDSQPLANLGGSSLSFGGGDGGPGTPTPSQHGSTTLAEASVPRQHSRSQLRGGGDFARRSPSGRTLGAHLWSRSPTTGRPIGRIGSPSHLRLPSSMVSGAGSMTPAAHQSALAEHCVHAGHSRRHWHRQRSRRRCRRRRLERTRLSRRSWRCCRTRRSSRGRRSRRIGRSWRGRCSRRRGRNCRLRALVHLSLRRL